MKTITVEATARTVAPAAVVWGALADARTWPSWSIQDEAELEREGSPTPDGVGAVRRFRTGRVKVREEVVRFDAPHHFGYRLLSGLPVRDYLAHIDLTEDASGTPGTPGTSGTSITWGATFRSGLPGLGWLLRRKIGEVLATSANRLAAQGDKLAASADQ
jgi:hypothetical protein